MLLLPVAVVRDAYEKNLIQVVKIHTDENVADLLTLGCSIPRSMCIFLHFWSILPCWMNEVSCGVLLYADLIFSRAPMLLVVLVHVDGSYWWLYSSCPPSPTRHTSVHEDISEGGGDFVSSPQSNEAPQTPVETANGGVEDSVALTALSLKIDRCLMKPFSSFPSAHVPENVPVGAGIFAAATTIPAGSPMDAAVYAAVSPSYSIPTAADKGKAPMVDDSLPVDLLSEQERVFKNLHDSQLGEELAKKIHAEQEAEFARQQEELAQKAQAERVASPTEHDWVEILAKIATNYALSKQLLGDDVTEDNMNERLGMLLLRKRRELAEQSRVKPMTKTQQRDYMRDFVTFTPNPTLDAPSAKRANQGVPQVPAASSQVPAAPTFAVDASVSAATTPEVPAAESHPDDTPTAYISVEHSVAASTHSSLCIRRKHITKKWVTPIVDIADASLIKLDSDSGSDDDPLPYAPYAGLKMVPSPLGSIHAYFDLAGHTKHFTSLRELNYWSLDDEDAHDF
nr:hypothetical protein [Tanacetum cinerariifolium]